MKHRIINPVFCLVALAMVVLPGPASAAEQDADKNTPEKVSQEFTAAVAENPGQLLDATSSYVSRYPEYCGEIVKAAIQMAKEDDGSKATPKTVALIVETAMRAAPESFWGQLLQSAVAIAPDAIVEIRAVVQALAPNNPALVAMVSKSPLNVPGRNTAPGASIAPPLVVNPPSVTDANPPRNSIDN